MPRAPKARVLPKTARIFHGDLVTDVRVAQIEPTRMTFVGTAEMGAKFARTAFKLDAQWFDVEGVVVARSTGSGACMCQLMFSAMSATESARLERALRQPTRPVVGDITRAKPIAVPRPAPKVRTHDADVHRLFVQALEDIAL